MPKGLIRELKGLLKSLLVDSTCEDMVAQAEIEGQVRDRYWTGEGVGGRRRVRDK